jgi:YD repeat-containing protein
MSHWNHRIIEAVEDGSRILAIHEVHYDDAGRPISHTDPVIVDGESEDELREMLHSMYMATTLPVLLASDFVSDVEMDVMGTIARAQEATPA